MSMEKQARLRQNPDKVHFRKKRFTPQLDLAIWYNRFSAVDTLHNMTQDMYF